MLPSRTDSNLPIALLCLGHNSYPFSIYKFSYFTAMRSSNFLQHCKSKKLRLLAPNPLCDWIQWYILLVKKKEKKKNECTKTSETKKKKQAKIINLWGIGDGVNISSRLPDVLWIKIVWGALKKKKSWFFIMVILICVKCVSCLYNTEQMSRWDTNLSMDFKINVYVGAGMITDKGKHFSFKRSSWQWTSSTFSERTWRPLESICT